MFEQAFFERETVDRGLTLNGSSAACAMSSGFIIFVWSKCSRSGMPVIGVSIQPAFD